MSDDRWATEVERLLTEHGAVLCRTKRHNVWTFPDGRTFTTAKTTSDCMASRNSLTDLRKMLGLTKTEATEGKRREKKNKPGRYEVPRLAEALKTAVAPLGLEVVDPKIREMGQEIHRLQWRLMRRNQMRRLMQSWWGWRIQRWIHYRIRLGRMAFRK
jgi:hypothetical protein